MAVITKGARIGAAAFALGLSLAGPQAVGVASADRGGANDSTASAGQARDSATHNRSGIRSRARQPGTVRSTVSAPGARARAAAAEKSVAAVEQLAPSAPGDPAGDRTTAAETPIEAIASGEPAEEAAEKPQTYPVDDTNPDGVSVEDAVVTPGRGGPDPKPWWRTTTVVQELPQIPDLAGGDDPAAYTAVADDIEPVPVAVESGNPRPLLLSGPAGAATQDAIATLRVRVAQVVSRVGDWLSGLPALPVTDFLSGALQLVRRTLQLPTIPKVSVDNVTVLESTPEVPQQAVFTVSLNRAYDSAVTVDYATEASTGADAAVPGADFTPVSGELIFAPGETAKQVAVEVLSDAIEEAPETFGLNVTTAFPSSTNVELAGAEGAIVGASFLDPFRLRITNQTGRDLEIKLCGDCLLDTIPSGYSREAKAGTVFGFIGSPELTFSATNSYWFGSYIDITKSGVAEGRYLLGANADYELLSEVPQPGWWDRFLVWAGLKTLPEPTLWVRDAGFKSFEFKRFPDATEPADCPWGCGQEQVTVAEIIVR